MDKALSDVQHAIERFMKKMDETERKITQTDIKIKKLREELEPLEVDVLDIASRLREVEHTLHQKLNKVKRVRKLYLNARTDRELKMYEKDYNQLMKDVHKLDKEYADLKEKYEKLVQKEEKLLQKEMTLESQKAELYHTREKMMKQATQLMGRLSAKINRTRNV